MIWIGSFLAGALLGALRAIGLRRRLPEMSRLHLILKSAAVLPGLVVILIAIGSLFSFLTMPDHGESGWGMSIFFLHFFGVPVALLSLLGGLIAAAALDRRDRS
jgi:hypothetical protein